MTMNGERYECQVQEQSRARRILRHHQPRLRDAWLVEWLLRLSLKRVVEKCGRCEAVAELKGYPRHKAAGLALGHLRRYQNEQQHC